MFRLKLGLVLISVVGLAVGLVGCGGSSSGGSEPGDFTLSLSSNNLTVEQGTQGTITVTIKAQNGFSGNVTLTAPASSGQLPPGVTASFSPMPATTTSTLTLAATATATTGKVQLTITGTSGSVTSTTPLTLNVTAGTGLPATTTTLSSSLNPSVFNQPITLTAAVTSGSGPLPASTNGEIITFSQAKTILGTGTLSGGSATLMTQTLTTGGTDNITAVYPGDANFAGSTSETLAQVVNPAPTTTTLTSSPDPSNLGQNVTFTATVTGQFGGTPTGSVAFFNGTTQEEVETLVNGVATYVTPNVPVGANSYTAVSNLNSAFVGSTSNVLTQTVGTGTAIDSSMTWNGITRYYEVFLPTALPANPAIVFMLHGTQINSTGSDPTPVIQLDWGWSAVANFYGFILVKPASTYDPTSNQWNWNSYCMDGTSLCAPDGSAGGAFAYAEGCGSTDGECPDDSGFLRQLIQNLTTQYNVNPSQVYFTGFSSGAQMTERVGVEISDLVAAIAPASGPMYNAQGTVYPIPLPGNALAPISVQEWHGTTDTELPPCGYGQTSYSGITFTLDTVDDTFNFWTGTQANAFTSQNAVFQANETLCTTVTPRGITTGAWPTTQTMRPLRPIQWFPQCRRP
jgi:poly(3-hydroxybutyrate) depolymerase